MGSPPTPPDHSETLIYGRSILRAIARPAPRAKLGAQLASDCGQFTDKHITKLGGPQAQVTEAEGCIPAPEPHVTSAS